MKQRPGQAHVIPPAPKIYKTLVRRTTSSYASWKNLSHSPFLSRRWTSWRRMSREKPEKLLQARPEKHRFPVSLSLSRSGVYWTRCSHGRLHQDISFDQYLCRRRIIFTHTSTTILMGMSLQSRTQNILAASELAGLVHLPTIYEDTKYQLDDEQNLNLLTISSRRKRARNSHSIGRWIFVIWHENSDHVQSWPTQTLLCHR